MVYRLLIVPGDNEDLRALQGQLADDVEVRVLDTANDALWEVRNSPPEVIVADVELPGMSGLDLAEILPNFGVPTRVVLWSRAPNNRAAEQAASHGVHLFLNGPLSATELHAALYEALGRGEGGVPLRPRVEPVPEPEPEPPPAPAPVAPVEPERPRRERHAVSMPPPMIDRSQRNRDRDRDRDRDRAAAPAPEPPPAPVEPPPVRRVQPPAPVEPPPVRRAPAPTPAPAPAPVEPPARRPSARPRGGSLVLTAENLKPIRDRMEALSQEINSQCIVLANRAGMVLTEVGITSGLPTMILLPLLSTSFSTAGQISQMLREEDSTALYMHEGNRYDLYCFDILQSFMLVIVFDKSGLATAKIGSVWVYAKRAIRDMQEMLG